MEEIQNPKEVPISTDLDHEVKLLAEMAGIAPADARRLIEQTGSFSDALKQLGIEPQAKPRPE
jgi:hypothetical protein